MSARKRKAAPPPVETPKPTGLVGYIRVSTEDQKLGPKVQREALQAWADREGVPLVSVHEDLGVSGGAPLDERPGLMAALDDLGPGVALLAQKRDRLARDVGMAALIGHKVEQAGATVVTCDGANLEGAEGDLMRCILDAFAQYERALIRSRTRSAMAKRKAEGGRVGTVPYGFRSQGKTLVPHAEEQAVMARVAERRAAGATLQGIIAELERDGVRPRGKKGKWHKTTIMRIANEQGIASPRGRGQPRKETS